MKECELYFCYSKNQYEYLQSKGLRYVVTGLSITTKKQFYVYFKTKELDTALNVWSKKENMR